jgi:hypothetical protein
VRTGSSLLKHPHLTNCPLAPISAANPRRVKSRLVQSNAKSRVALGHFNVSDLTIVQAVCADARVRRSRAGCPSLPRLLRRLGPQTTRRPRVEVIPICSRLIAVHRDWISTALASPVNQRRDCSKTSGKTARDLRPVQQWGAVITTEGDEVEISRLLVSLQSPGHGRRVRGATKSLSVTNDQPQPPQNARKAGAPGQFVSSRARKARDH